MKESYFKKMYQSYRVSAKQTKPIIKLNRFCHFMLINFIKVGVEFRKNVGKICMNLIKSELNTNYLTTNEYV